MDSHVLVLDDSVNLDPGTFTTEGYHLYKTTRKLEEDLTYHLRIHKPNTNYEDTRASTPLVGGTIKHATSIGFQV
ncbi:MAG: hypothetical protein U5L96_10495 [Owenweeksia sp.]|nr:hypothetical protein [Owenweeksia sp.]